MSITALQTIQLRAPQWASDPRINDLIAYAATGLSASVLGVRYGIAVGLKVCHILAVEQANGGNPGTGTSSGSGTAGALTSESEGGLSRSYGAAGSGMSGKMLAVTDLDSTAFGTELLTILQSSTLFPRTRRM
jgi:hypothetical protein